MRRAGTSVLAAAVITHMDPKARSHASCKAGLRSQFTLWRARCSVCAHATPVMPNQQLPSACCYNKTVQGTSREMGNFICKCEICFLLIPDVEKESGVAKQRTVFLAPRKSDCHVYPSFKQDCGWAAGVATKNVC